MIEGFEVRQCEQVLNHRLHSFRTVNQDLIAADSRDTQFYRYVSLSNRFTAGACADTALVQDRQALIKMMNMLSIDAKPGSVVPIDQKGAVASAFSA